MHETQAVTGPPVRVLLVEDNPGDVYIISLALEEAGFTHAMTNFGDGADALTFLRNAASVGGESLPELVLLDLNLPRVDGTAVLTMLRTEPALCQIPVMLLSSSRSPEDIARAQKFPKCIFAVKPSDLSDYMALGRTVKEFWIRNRNSEDAQTVADAVAG